MKVTLHEVAARAGVSIATVSRALNGLPVSEKNQSLVREAVDALGYVANEAARALRSDKSMTMGIIFADLRNTLGIDLLDALSDAIEEAGYSLIIATARNDARRFDVLMHRFLERRLDALFLIHPPGRLEYLDRYEAARTPVMTMFGSGPGVQPMPNVSPSFSDPAKALAEHLHGLGHRKVAMLGYERSAGPMAAIAEALKAHGQVVEIVETPPGAGMTETVRSLMAMPGRPTAVLTRDPAVRGLMVACAAQGVKVPDDLSVVSLNDITSESYHRKHAISSVTVDPHRMGKASGAAMLAWLAGSRPAERIRVQVASFYPRASIGAAPRT